jgi:hypothetical protein
LIRDRQGELVFIGSLRNLAYVADVDIIEVPLSAREIDAKKESAPLNWLDVASKAAAVISSLAVVALTVLLASGESEVGSVQVDSVLTIFAFTLVGGLISVGGVQLFTLSASLRRAKDRVEQVASQHGSDESINLISRRDVPFKLTDTDELAALSNVGSSGSDWQDALREKFQICVSSRDFPSFLEEQIERARHEGWKVTAAAVGDTLNDGLMITLTLEQSYS